MFASCSDIKKTSPNQLIQNQPRSNIENTPKVNISISYNLNIEGILKPVNVTVIGSVVDPIFKLNGKIVGYESKSNSNYKLMLKFDGGINEIAVEAIGADKELVVKKYTAFVKSEYEIAAEQFAAKEAEQKIIDEEKQRRIQLEAVARAKKAEEARIVREGDGSPDDVSCKKYGLVPQTQGYAECRMRLDLSRKESQARSASIERAKDEDLRNRNEAIERQNAITSNRESQCQFIKAQEYFRPATGGFFQSAQNAESAYQNCIAGIPQITTTCTRDAFGNVNCNSR